MSNFTLRDSVLIALLFTLSIQISTAQIVDLDNIFEQLDDCDSAADVCLDIPMIELTNYRIHNNGDLYQGMISGCNADTTFTYNYSSLFGSGALGPYSLDSWTVNGTTFTDVFMDIDELVTLMNTWDPQGNWVHEPISQSIIGGFPSNVYSIMNVTSQLVNAEAVLGFNMVLEPKGIELSFERGAHKVVITEIMSGIMDTFCVYVACPQPEEISYDIAVGDTGMHCLDFSELLGDVVSVVNLCEDPTNMSVDFGLDMSNCVTFTGLAEGEETVCMYACDEYGFCDSTTVIVNVTNAIDFLSIDFDTLLVGDMGSFCFDVSDLNGNIVSVTNDCDTSTPDEVVFSAIDNNTYCVDYEATEVGVDGICFTFIDSDGTELNATLTVTVLPVYTGPEWIVETITLGNTFIHCLDVTDIGGSITQVYNDCEDLSGSSVNFGINNVSLCIEAEGTALGTDTACIVICNDLSLCDTTFFSITVVNEAILPVANPDSSTTSQNASVVINVCDNDVIPDNELTEFYVLQIADGGSGPNNGIATFNNDCTITYEPDPNFCGEDIFDYVICNSLGCDTTSVSVTVDCSNPSGELIIRNAMSPNEDGINDNFVIEGLGNYPDHSLCIYNRWGNIVRPESKYNNDWNAVWDGSELPDGTYFYVLNLGNGDNLLTGYLQVHR